MPRNGHHASQRGGQIIHFGSPTDAAIPTSPGGSENRVLTDKYRRNGKLQSCEPCRKSKLACDHRLDGCGRCRKRRRVDLCVYHPNPMTHTRSPSNANSTAATASSSSATATSGPPSVGHDSTSLITTSEEYIDTGWHSTPGPSHKVSVLPFDAPTPGRFHRALSEPCMELRRDSARVANEGFAGDTSYSAILIEGLGGNAELLDAHIEGIMEPDLKVPSSKIVKGAAALEFLKNREMIEGMVDMWFERFEVGLGPLIEPILRIWMDELWKNFMPVLASPRAEGRRRLSEQIWRNSRSPMVFDGSTTAAEWARLATGQNLRWATVGMLALTIGWCAKCFSASDLARLKSKDERQEIAEKTAEIGELCIQYCRDCETLDDLFAWTLFLHANLVSVTKGDQHYATYQASGEVPTVVVAMGLHQRITPSDKVPWFLAEIRRRLYGQVWLHEIGLASFLGRPPRLSYRYSVLDIPLDLTDEQLMLSGPELSAALANLDERGFDTTGRRPLQMTYWRSYYPFGRLREDVLDLALGHYTAAEVVSRGAQIQAALDAEWERLPSVLDRVKEEPLDTNGPPLQVLLRNTIRQGVRATRMILQRVLIRRTGAKPDDLVATAQAIFADILALSQKHDIAAISQLDITGVLVFHGLRSAAIMSIELLRQEQMAVYPEKPLLPRSKTIQELAVFASRLASVDPSDGSYATCIRAKHVIEKILDKILSPDKDKPPSSSAVTPSGDIHERTIRPSEPTVSYAPTAEATAGFMPPFAQQVGFPGGGEQGQEDFRMMDVGLDISQDQDFMQWLNGMDSSWNGF